MARYFFLSGGISVKLDTNIRHVSGIVEKVFKVRGQGRRSKFKVMCECCNCGCVHFSGVAWRLSCFTFFLISK